MLKAFVLFEIFVGTVIHFFSGFYWWIESSKEQNIYFKYKSFD